MQIDGVSLETPELTDKFIEIQDIIYNIDSSNLEETESELENINLQMNESLYNLKSNLDFLLKALKSAMISRPFYNESHFLLISHLSEQIKKHFSSKELYFLFSVNYFRLKLYQLELIDFETIMEFARQDEMRFLYFCLEIEELYPEEYARKIAIDNWLKCKIYSFAGFHRLLGHQLKEKPKSDDLFGSDNILSPDAEIDKSSDIDIDPKAISQGDEIKRKKRFREMRDAGFNENDLAVFIRDDDISNLQAYKSQSNISVDTTLPHSIFERCDFLNDSSTELIDYAAFFGSMSVFKFLILNTTDEDRDLLRIINQIADNAPIDSFPNIKERLSSAISRSLHLFKYAIAGGNYDIIHLCEEQKSLKLNIDNESGLISDYSDNANVQQLFGQLDIKYNVLFCTAIRFHRNEIYDYLADNYYDNFYDDVLEKNVGNMLIENFNTSITYYNLDIFFRLLPIVIRNNLINSHDSDRETPLHVAAINGRFDIVKLLCSIDGIDINSQAKNMETPLQWAISYGHMDIVKFFLGLEGIDHIAENDIGISIFIF